MDNYDELKKIYNAIQKANIKNTLGVVSDIQFSIMPKVEPIIKSESFDKTFDLVRELYPSINNTFKFVDEYKPFMLRMRYLSILDEAKWPLFLYDSVELQRKVCCIKDNEQNKSESIRRIVVDFFTDDELNFIENRWLDCDILKKERFPLLSEALFAYRNGLYYVSTATLMCQIYGIISDIIDFTKENGFLFEEDEKDFISEYFEIKRDCIDNEKGKILQTIFMEDNRLPSWSKIAVYLKEEILSSSESKARLARQPSRNKICHGDQLNFGTQEHALKAILIIDILIQLACDIKYVVLKKE